MSSSSGEEEFEVIDKNTNFAKGASGERLDCPPYERPDEDEVRVMVERPAGSNQWYQYYYLGESKNEVKLRVPTSRKAPEHIEWINKKSSRLSRIGLATRLWKYLKGTDGAWAPRGTDAASKPAPPKKKPAKEAAPAARRARKRGGSPAGEAEDAGGAAKTAPRKRTRVQPAKGKEKEATSPRSSDSTSTAASDDDGAREAGMTALAGWFKQHDAALTMRLPGNAESQGVEAPESKKKATPAAAASPPARGANRRKTAVVPAAGNAAGGMDSDADSGLRKAQSGGGGSGPVGAARRKPQPQQAADGTQLTPHTKHVPAAAPLEENDLFGGAKSAAAAAAPKPAAHPAPAANGGAPVQGHRREGGGVMIKQPSDYMRSRQINQAVKTEGGAGAGGAVAAAVAPGPAPRLEVPFLAFDALAAVAAVKARPTESGDSTRAGHAAAEGAAAGDHAAEGPLAKKPAPGPSAFQREAAAATAAAKPEPQA